MSRSRISTIGSRHRNGPLLRRSLAVLTGLLLCAGGMAIPSQTSWAQTLSFYGGFSDSWGERSLTICTLTCGPGKMRSHENLSALAGGLGVTYGSSKPLRFETGFFVTRKGWQVTGPTLQALYIEIPALVQLGYWPRGRGGGFSIGGGGAIDLGLSRFADTRPVALLAAQIHASPGGRSLWSLGVRYTRGLITNYDLYVHAITFVLGFSPSGAAP